MAMGLAYTAAWLSLDRALMGRAVLASLVIAVAASIAAGIALVAMRFLARRPWTARLAAALFLLVAGTGGLTSLFLGAHTAWLTHALPDLPLHYAIFIIALISAGTLYSFLSIAGFLLLPLGMPLILLFAIIAARRR